MAAEKRYVQVIVPLRLEWEPYYALDGQEIVSVGDFVAVPFAGRKYIGAVSACDVILPDGMNPGTVREIYSVHPEIPPLTELQIEFWRQVAMYYMCTVGEVLKSACPASRNTYSTPRRTRAAEFVPAADQVNATEESERISVLVGNALGTTPVLLQSNLDVDAVAMLCKKKNKTLWLVPDIATLKYVEARLRPLFGSLLLVFSREMTPAKRYALEDSMRSLSSFIVLGTRGALFLPFDSLSLVVVQEEHSPQYKQNGVSPRYNARDCAVMLAGVHGAEVLLHSPTPSLESVYNCFQRKYKCLKFGPAPIDMLGDVETLIVDTRAELRKNGMVGDIPKMLLPEWNDDCSKISFVKLQRALFPKSEDIQPQLASLFGDNFFFSDDPVGCPVEEDTQVLCVFGMDALLSKADFRADERALHELYKSLEPCRSNLRRLVVLTRQPAHSIFRPGNGESLDKFFDTDRLLAERRDLSLPPFSRMVDIHFRTAGMVDWLASYVPSFSANSYRVEDGWRVVMAKDKNLANRKQTLMSDVSKAEKELHCPNSVFFDVDP